MAACRVNGEYIQYDTANATEDKGLVVVSDAIFNATLEGKGNQAGR